MSMTELEASRDLRRVERALKRRQEALKDPGKIVMAKDKITDVDRDLFGRPVRFEIDVCVPINHLREDLRIIKADLERCVWLLDQPGTPHEKRFGVHRKLSAIRARLKLRRKVLADPNLSNVLKGQTD